MNARLCCGKGRSKMWTKGGGGVCVCALFAWTAAQQAK